VLVGAAAAILASTFSAIRVLRPLERVRRATRRLASGHYTQQIPIPVETELAALAHDVNALGEALEKVEERRVRLIAEVAHELRTPLTTIQGYMEGLLDGVFEPTEEVFAATAREATRLQRLAADRLVAPRRRHRTGHRPSGPGSSPPRRLIAAPAARGSDTSKRAIHDLPSTATGSAAGVHQHRRPHLQRARGRSRWCERCGTPVPVIDIVAYSQASETIFSAFSDRSAPGYWHFTPSRRIACFHQVT
jgi:HAMP domain-containing protein